MFKETSKVIDDPAGNKFANEQTEEKKKPSPSEALATISSYYSSTCKCFYNVRKSLKKLIGP